VVVVPLVIIGEGFGFLSHLSHHCPFIRSFVDPHPYMMLSSHTTRNETTTAAPSGTPSMTLDRVITLGTAADLKIQEMTTSSYGYIFNMRTKIDGESGSSVLPFRRVQHHVY
jgi:hypothetical protein